MAEKKHRSLNVMFGDSEWDLITKEADSLGISLGAAVRILVRRGGTAPGHSPFTPQEPKRNPQ